MINNGIMAKPSRPHAILESARTRNRNTTWDGLMFLHIFAHMVFYGNNQKYVCHNFYNEIFSFFVSSFTYF